VAGVSHAKYFLPLTTANTGAENNHLHDEFKGMSRAQIAAAKGLNEKDLGGGSLSHHGNCLLKPYGCGAFARMQTVIGADCKVYTFQDTAYTETGIWTIYTANFFANSDIRKKTDFNLRP
jgi:hypothetical protein